MKKNKTMIFLFILPTVLCLLFMYVYPVVRTVIMSFFKVESLTATTSTWSFYGLQNYFKILRNAGFISSIKNMVMIWLVGGIITMCLSMLMAVILTSRPACSTHRTSSSEWWCSSGSQQSQPEQTPSGGCQRESGRRCQPVPDRKCR